ncbi:MAG: hypothetical protein ACEQSB_00885 [Undibacterium sp.]
MTEKRLALSLFFLFALSAAYLTAVNLRGTDPNGKNWWNLAFADPKNENSLVFTVSNYTNDERFTYRVASEAATLAEGEIQIPNGTSREVTPTMTITSPEGRFTITVSHLGKEQAIYRSL